MKEIYHPSCHGSSAYMLLKWSKYQAVDGSTLLSLLFNFSFTLKSFNHCCMSVDAGAGVGAGVVVGVGVGVSVV